MQVDIIDNIIIIIISILNIIIAMFAIEMNKEWRHDASQHMLIIIISFS